MMPYVIRISSLDLDDTHTWQRPSAPRYLRSSFRPFTTAYSVYPTLKGATRQRDILKRRTTYAFCRITVEELTP